MEEHTTAAAGGAAETNPAAETAPVSEPAPCPGEGCAPEEDRLRLEGEREATRRERARLVAEEQVRQIGELDGEIRSMEDLLSMPAYESFYALVKKGVSLVDAYKLTCYDKLMKRAADAAARQTMRSVGSRQHFTAVAGQPGTGEYTSVPAEVAAEYRLAKPGITDEEIRRKYRRYQKYQRQ